MKPWETLAVVTTPDGTCFELQCHDGDYLIHANGYELMTSGAHSSEDAMMSIACPSPSPNACVLVGGLGMGYTLAATLALMPLTGTVIVSELIPEIVDWNRGPLGPLAGNPLKDLRTKLIVGDVADVIRRSTSQFDAILLDIDNSYNSFSQAPNFWLYTPEGRAAIRSALRPGGGLAIWSVGTDRTFERNLRKAGFAASTHPVRERNGRGGHHSIVLGRIR